MQILFAKNVYSLELIEERDFLFHSLKKSITYSDVIEISNQYRLWFFVEAENYLDFHGNNKRNVKQQHIHKYKFYVVLSDTKGNIVDSTTEKKIFDSHIYQVFRGKDIIFDLTGKNVFAYGFQTIFGKIRASTRIAGELEKSYTKLFLYTVDNGKIKKIIDNFTLSFDQATLDEKKCNGSIVYRFSNLSLSNQQTNGFFDFIVSTEINNTIYNDCIERIESIKKSEIYKFDGNFYRNVNTSVVSVEKASLYDSPDTKSKTKMYLIKGDFVIIRDRKTKGGSEWILVDYDSEQLGITLKKWMHAVDVVLLFN